MVNDEGRMRNTHCVNPEDVRTLGVKDVRTLGVKGKKGETSRFPA